MLIRTRYVIDILLFRLKPLHQFKFLFLIHLDGFPQDRRLSVGESSSVDLRILSDKLAKFLFVDELDIVVDSLIARKWCGIIHEILPERRVFTCVLLIIKDHIVIETEVRTLIVHDIRVDRLTFERITVVLGQELEEKLV